MAELCASPASAFRHVHCQAAEESLFIYAAHVEAGLSHGADDLVQGDAVLAVAMHGETRGVDGLHRTHGVALDTGDLHQATHRIAGEPQVVLHADLGGVLDLRIAAAHG